MEKVDDEPSYGEVPGSAAYQKRQQDAVPDEVEIIPEGKSSRRNSFASLDPSFRSTSPVPRTVVQKIDPSQPSYGEVPGTQAYALRLADAAPDLVLKASDGDKGPIDFDSSTAPNKAMVAPIPEIVTPLESPPINRSALLPDAAMGKWPFKCRSGGRLT